jgi:hypothetical protein
MHPLVELTETAGQEAAQATSTVPDGGRITVTLSIDVEMEVERLGDFYLAYWVEGPKPAEEPLLSAFRMCDIDSQVTENDRVSGLGSWSTGASTVGTVARFSWMTSRLIRAR